MNNPLLDSRRAFRLLALCTLVGFLPACPLTPTEAVKAPGSPTIGTASPGDASASITFSIPASNGGANITSYTVTCSSAGAADVSATGSSSPIVVTGLTNGVTYSCVVSATNSSGTGAQSGSVMVTPFTVPDAPAIGTVTPSSGQATVEFSAPASDGGSAITGYTATCRVVTAGSSLTASGTSSPLVVTGLTNGVEYACSVVATNAAGPSAASSSANVTPVGIPGAPALGAVTPGNGSASVSFTPPSSNGGSAIIDYTASCVAGSSAAVSATSNAGPITVTGLTNGTAYQCSVTARNEFGTSAASSTGNVTPRTVPGAPTIGAVTAGDASATVAFTAPASNGGAPINTYQASCAPTGGGSAATATGGTSPLTVSPLTNGTQYACSVSANNAAGTGPASASASVTPMGVPSAPTITSVTAGNGTATVAFTAPASNGGSLISSYTASCRIGSGAATEVSGPGSPIVVSGLTNGSTYACSVTATNSVGTSPASTPTNVTPTGPVLAPGAPTIGTVTAGNASATVAFTPGATGGATPTYTATCSLAPYTPRTATGSASPLQVTGMTMTNGAPWSCSVTATNSAGTSPASSSASVIPTAGGLTGHVYCSYSHSFTNATLGLTASVSYTCNSSSLIRTMMPNQIPDHAPGTFPNCCNPHPIAVQSTPASVTFTLNPAAAASVTQKSNVVGWALNGVKFDPATAETCPEKSYCPDVPDSSTTWNVEALNQTLFSAGADSSNAHVQPGGAYHYHGMPQGYLDYLNKGQAMTLVGFAVDGFPVYAKWGYATANDSTSAVREILSSYRKKATPTAGRVDTNTVAMGTFTQDWEYVAELGDLDECNGRTGVTPEFPSGIYHYFITTGFPYIQRCLKGTVPPGGPAPVIRNTLVTPLRRSGSR